MEIKAFRNAYDLELIPVGIPSIILGTLVWDPVFGPPVFDHPGMPNHLYNAFLSSGIIDENEFISSLEELRNHPRGPANLGTSNIDVDVSIAHEFNHPGIGELNQNFSLTKTRKFSFGNIEVRSIPELERVRIDSFLDILKKENWSQYDGKIRRVFLITELYYGSVRISIDKQYKNELEAGIASSTLDVTSTIDNHSQIEYTFSHNDVPFAMRIERVRGFVG